MASEDLLDRAIAGTTSAKEGMLDRAIQDVQGGVWQFGSPYENPLLHVERPQTIQERTEAAGVRVRPETEEARRALSAARMGGSFAATGDIGSDVQAAQTFIGEALSRFYGRPIEFRQGEQTGRLEFRPEGDEQWTLVDEPDISAADFKEMAGPALVGALESLGALGGAALGTAGAPGPGTATGAIAGGSLGAFVGEVARINAGRLMGVNENLTADQIITEAAIAAGLAGAGGVVGDQVLKLGHAIQRWFTGSGALFGKNMVPEAAIKAAQEPMERNIQIARKVQRGTQKPFKPTTAELTEDPELLALQARYTQTPSMGQVRQFEARRQANYEALEDFLQQSSVDFDVPDVGPYAVGKDIQRALGEKISQVRGRAQRGLEAARERAETATEKMAERAAPKEGVGGLVREAAEQERKALSDWADDVYSQVDDQLAGTEFPLKRTRKFGQTELERIQNDLFPSLTQENKTLFREAAGEVGEDIGDIATVGQIMRARSQLKADIRLADKGLVADRNLGAKKKLLQKLDSDFKAALTPEQRLLVEATEAEYARRIRLVNRSVLGRVMKATEGEFKLDEAQIFDSVFRPGNVKEAKDLASVLSDYPQAMLAFKQAINNKYVNEVVKDGVADPAKHKAFMAKYGKVMEPFYSRSEKNLIARAGGTGDALKRAQLKHDRVLNAINKTFGVRLNNLDPEKILSTVWGREKIGQIAELKRLLRNDPDYLKSFQTTVLEDMRSRVMSRNNVLRTHTLSGPKLADYLDQHGNALRELFGSKYVNDLQTLSDAVNMVNKDAAMINWSGTASALTDIARAYVGLFTTAGRMLTAVNKIRGRVANETIGDAVLNPGKFKMLMELRKLSPQSRRAAVIAGQLGALSLVAPEQEEMTERTVE